MEVVDVKSTVQECDATADAMKIKGRVQKHFMSSQHFINIIQHPVKFRMFLFSKLPSAFFAGVKVKHVDEQRCEVTVPYKWFSQNPFRSTYFACLSMAAEMSTGVLALMHTYHSVPAVSILVKNMEANFIKKATGTTYFVCEEGDLIKKRIEQTKMTGEAYTIKVKSTGTNAAGELVAEFWITWSFKRK